MSSDSDSEVDEGLQNLLLQRLDQINGQLLGDDGENKSGNKKRSNIKAAKRTTEKESKEPKSSVKSQHRKKTEEFQRNKELRLKKIQDVLRKDISVKNTGKRNKRGEEDSLNNDSESEEFKANFGQIKKGKKRKEKTKDGDLSGKETTLQETFDSVGDDWMSDEDQDIDDSISGDEQMDDSDPFDQSEDEYMDQGSVDHPKGSLQRQLQEFKQKLGLTEQDFVNYRKCKEQSETQEKGRAAVQENPGGRRRLPPEVIVFEDPAKRKKGDKKKSVIPGNAQLSRKKIDLDTPLFDLITAKHEVQTFGIQGLDGTSKQEAKVDLLVSLGAKKPKNLCVNYKEYMKQQREEKKTREATSTVMKLQDKRYQGASAANSKNRRRKNKSDFGDGQLGQYKQGVQVIGKEDLQRIKSTRTSKRKR